MAKQSKSTNTGKATKATGTKRPRAPWKIRAEKILSRARGFLAALTSDRCEEALSSRESAQAACDAFDALLPLVQAAPDDFKARVPRVGKVAFEPGMVVQVRAEKYGDLYSETLTEVGMEIDAELTITKVSGKFVWVKLKGGSKMAALASHLAPVME